jgi:hypothetical protein
VVHDKAFDGLLDVDGRLTNNRQNKYNCE